MHTGDLAKGYYLLENASIHAYVMSVGYPPLQDAAQFYWGTCRNFVDRTPLISPYTKMVLIDEERVCDINTLDDWDMAVAMYEDLRG
jgi:hypothetical protein